MDVSPGTRLGPYEIVSLLGAGGMGEVYRARDTRLNRDVALKVLPEAFALDADRLARFKREAQVLASLNHPHIAAIHGFEESQEVVGAGFLAAPKPSGEGGSRPVQALVLELVEGPTLADRIAERPMPLDEALPIARQIAEALEAVHEHGIVHRDLKPANVKVRPDGTVKVLDFCLAKAFGPAMTGIGVILGTAAYMSPEQARGKPIDKRSDVWAFGCVLYEMVTGQRAFGGEDVSETLATVLKGEPDWTLIPADVPVRIRALIRRSLEKDRRKRIGDLSTALFIIDEPASVEQPAIALRPSLARRVARTNTQGPDRDVWIEDLDRRVSTRVTFGGIHWFPVWMPDGRRVVYAAGLPNSNLFSSAANGTGSEERLTTSPNPQLPGSVSADGEMLAYVEFDPLRNADIWLLPLRGDRLARPFLQTRFSEGSPKIAPDGRWHASSPV